MRLAAGMCVCTKAMMSLGASSPQKRACDRPGMAGRIDERGGHRIALHARGAAAQRNGDAAQDQRETAAVRAQHDPRSAGGASLLPEHY